MLASAELARRRACYADLSAIPENAIGEIIDGDLLVRPRPALLHASAATTLCAELGPPFNRGRGGPGGWIILFEPELHLLEDVVVPDVAGWRRERMPEVPDLPWAELAPDWLCEVLSPRTALVDRRCKLPIYAREHVAHMWLLDPAVRSLEVFRLDGESYRLAATFGSDEQVRAEPFGAIELDLGVIWTR